jgi:hypothetical protein
MTETALSVSWRHKGVDCTLYTDTIIKTIAYLVSVQSQGNGYPRIYSSVRIYVRHTNN